MTKTPTIQPDNAYVQILAKADSELSRLAAEERRIHLQIQADSAALQELGAAIAAHETEKAIAQQTVDTRRTALREAEARAQLAEGTLSKPGDIKNLERLLKQAQADQLVILDRIGKAEQAEERRRQALEEAMERNQRTLSHLAEKQEAMIATKQRVFAEQGEAELNQVQTKLDALREQRNQQTAAMAQLDEEIETEERLALQRLESWPELQRHFTSTLTHQDSFTHILDSSIAFIERVLAEGRGAEIPWEVSQQLHMQFMGLSELLSIDPLYLRPAFRVESTASTDFLEERKGQIENVLRVYRELKA